MGSENLRACAKNAEIGFRIDFFTVMAQRWQWISQSHTSNMMKPGFDL
jgi:hypothetical protein